MRVKIDADSQEEFDSKREELLKSIAGSKFDLVIKARKKTVYDKQKPAIAERKAYFTAQNQMMEYWDKQFKDMIQDIKKDIKVVLHRN